MPTLLLLRHARAESFAPTDHARPLDHSGIQQARGVGEHVLSSGLVPDLVLCSTALRTRQTWAEIESTLDGAFAGTVYFLDELYEAEPATVASLLSTYADGCERVLIVGHEPIMSMTAQAYADEASDPAAVFSVQAGMPTAGLARISLTSWAETRGTLVSLRR